MKMTHFGSFLVLYWYLCIPFTYSTNLWSFIVSVQNTDIVNKNIQLILHWNNYSFYCNSSYHNNSQYSCEIRNLYTCDYTHYVAYNGLNSVTIYNIDGTTELFIRQIILQLYSNNNLYYAVNQSLNSSQDSITLFLANNMTHSYDYPFQKQWQCHNIKVFSFGFNVAPNMRHYGDVTLTLYWFDQILQCVISTPHHYISTETDFICNQSDIILLATHSEDEVYKMQLQYDESAVFGPLSVFIIDLFGNRFDIVFCGSALLNDTQSQNCPYIASNVKMSNRSMYTKLVYIHFSNQYSIGLISYSKITSFGIGATVSAETNIYLILHWNAYVYVCSLQLYPWMTMHLCNASNTNINVSSEITNDSKFKLIIIKTDSNAIEIDHVYINDETNDEHSINIFCQETLDEISCKRTIYVGCHSCQCVFFMFSAVEYNYLLLLLNLSCDLSNNETSYSTTAATTDSMAVDLYPMIIVSVFVILILSVTLIGCFCYIRILQRRLKQHTQREPQQKSKSKSKDFEAGTLEISQLTPLNTEIDLETTCEPPGVQRPSLISTATTNKSITSTIYTDPSHNAEGYLRSTKLDSAVHLEVIQVAESNDENLLNGMLEDVMRMKSLEKYQSIQNTDESNDDDMYDISTMVEHEDDEKASELITKK